MRTLIWFIFFWIYLFAVLPKLQRCKKLTAQGRIGESDAIMQVEVRKWARSLLRLAGADIQVTGLEHVPQEPVVFVGNHQGNFDIPLMLGYLPKPCGVLAKDSLAKMPLIRQWMQLLHCVFIDRSDPRQAVKALAMAGEQIQRGYSMVIFPEGTRSRGDAVGEFKGGAFRVATKVGAPIVPLCIDGTYKLMESQGFWIRPAKIKVKLLPPIATKDLDKEQIKALDEQVRQLIIEEKSKL